MDWGGFLGVVGPVSITILFVILGLLSRRLGRVTRTAPYYYGLYLAAALMAISTVARLVNLGRGSAAATALRGELGGVIIYTGLPALSVTIGVFVVWRYWSWLLAERE